jgi:hypothetical protein
MQQETSSRGVSDRDGEKRRYLRGRFLGGARQRSLLPSWPARARSASAPDSRRRARAAQGEASWRKPWPAMETWSGGAGRGGEERVVSGNLWNGVKRKRRDRERAVETTGTGEGTGGGGGGIPGEGGGWINFPSFFSPPPHPHSFSWIFLCGRYLNCSESAYANNIFYLLDDLFFVYVSVFFHR